MSNPIVKLARQQILRMLDGQRVQVPTSVGLLEMEAKADDRWDPMRQIPIPPGIQYKHEQMGLPTPDEVWVSDAYEVFVKRSEEGGTHLSIKRLDRAAIHNWRHFQQIKNEVCGDFFEAIELYPGEHRVADNANQYHLWVMPEGVEVPVGFHGGMVLIDDDDVERFNSNGDKGRQEPMQEGLTMGQGMSRHQRDAMTEADRDRVESVLRGDLA